MNAAEFDKVTQAQPNRGGRDDLDRPEMEAANVGASDETTGASPGTAQACDDLGLNSLEQNLKRLGIKPPGQS